MAEFPIKPLYLFYGSRTEDVLAARDGVLNQLLPAESRNENLTEYYPTRGETVALATLYDEIAGDMATISFIPGSTKVVVVTNPVELFGGAGGARRGEDSGPNKAQQRMLGWVERELPATGAHLLLLAFEDEAAQREVNQRSPLYQLVQKIGFLRGFMADQKAFFRIEEAILGRNLARLIEAVRELWKPGKGDMPVYNSAVRCLRYLLQANIARDRKALADPTAQARYFPGDPSRNLFKAHDAVRRKYLARPVYRTADVVKAYEGLLEVYRALRPRPDDLYVPDAQGMLEETLVRLLASPRPRID